MATPTLKQKEEFHYESSLIAMVNKYPRDLFWSVSEVNNAFRPSEMLCKVLQALVNRLFAFHSEGLVNENGLTALSQVYFIKESSTVQIAIRVDNVTKNDDAYVNERKSMDYAGVAALIEELHFFHQIPDISTQNCPELVEFLELLKNPLGKEMAILKHCALWDSKKRVNFLRDLQSNMEYTPFKEMGNNFLNDGVNLTERNGGVVFWQVFENDIFLSNRFYYKCSLGEVPYMNTMDDMLRFIRNQFSYFSVDSDYTHCHPDMEWRIYTYFPFYLLEVCKALDKLGLLYPLQ